MFTTRKLQIQRVRIIKNLWFFIILTGMFLMVSSCDEDLEMNTDGPNPPGNSGNNQINADELSGYLVLSDATTHNNALPVAMDGQMKTDAQSTIYLVKGYTYGNRIQVKHDPSQMITCFNIYVKNASYYFKVPVLTIEGESKNDSISSLILDLDLPDDLGIDYPFTAEIIIQPCNDLGTTWDEFIREITIEDPQDDSQCNDITQPFQASSNPRWRWDFTIREVNGEIKQFSAPNLKDKINLLGWGCCVNGNISTTASESFYCREGTTQPGYEWKEMEVDDYIVRSEENMWLYDNGVLDVKGIETKKQYLPSLSNFCTEELGYENSMKLYGAKDNTPVGTHDFSPGATTLSLNTPNWEGPYRVPSQSNIVYTCHVLYLLYGGGAEGGSNQYITRYEDRTTMTDDNWLD